MRKRKIAVLFRLNEKEAEALNRKVKRSGLSREAYLRQVIRGVIPRDAPPPDYYAMRKELSRVREDLERIAQGAQGQKPGDGPKCEEALKRLDEAVRRILEAVILPEGTA